MTPETPPAVRCWLGIDYAEPIDGARRWSAPVAVDGEPRGRFAPSAWQGQLPCGPMTGLYQAAQPSGDDCLALNVWAPDTPGPHPVLVWVHGGGLVVGDGANPVYDGAALASQGLVVVALNYRLGHQGFLPVPDSTNRGLLDVLAALQWVSRNVARFSGDPGAVTVAGHSGGASIVLALLASPLAAGLFRRAALISPTQTPFVASQALDKASRRYLELLGPRDRATGEHATAAGAALDTEIFAKPSRFGAAGRRRSAIGLTTGTPELPLSPLQALAQGASSDVDVLVGSTADEWRFYTRLLGTPSGRIATLGMAALTLGPSRRLPAVLRLGDTDAVMTAAAFSLLVHRIGQVHQGRTWTYESGAAADGLDGRLGAGHGSDLPLWLGNTHTELARTIGATDDDHTHSPALAAFVRGSAPWQGTYPHVHDLGPRSPRSLDRRRLHALAAAVG